MPEEPKNLPINKSFYRLSVKLYINTVFIRIINKKINTTNPRYPKTAIQHTHPDIQPYMYFLFVDS